MKQINYKLPDGSTGAGTLISSGVTQTGAKCFVIKGADESLTLIRDEDIQQEGGNMGSNRREDFKPEPPKLTADFVIGKYIKLRDEIDTKTKALQAELAGLKELQGKCEKWLTTEMDRIGTTTLKKTGVGTAFFEEVDSATVGDGQTFMAWISENFEERKTFLENRVSKTAVKQGLADGNPPPPGINYTKTRVIRIRRA